MYLFFEKETWEKFKADTVANAPEKQKVFVSDFFEMIEKHGTWGGLPE